MFRFGRTPPAAPPAPEDSSSTLFVIEVASLAGVTVLLCVFAGLYVRRRWSSWLDSALATAFDKCDRDRSGKINKDEFYIAILETYLELHLYGLNVRSPKQERMLRMLDEMDLDASGDLDRDEFRLVVSQLLKTQTSRIATQVALTVFCPITSGYVAQALRHAIRHALDVMSLERAVPSAFQGASNQLPETLDETLICGVMMLSVAPALEAVDRFFEQRYHVRRTAAAKAA